MRLTIFRKLLLGFLGVVLLVGLVGGTAYLGITRLLDDGRRQSAVTDDVVLMGDLMTKIKSVEQLAANYLTSGRAENQAQFQMVEHAILAMLEQQQRTAADEQERAVWNDIAASVRDLTQVSVQALFLQSPVGNPSAPALIQEVDRAGAIVEQQANRVREMVLGKAVQQQNESRRLAEEARSLVVALTMAAGLAGMGLAYLIARGVTRPVGEVTLAFQELAAGNLAAAEVPVRTRDEAGLMAQAFNGMLRELRVLVRQLSESSRAVSAKSGQISAATDELSGVAEGVARSVGRVAEGASHQSRSVQEGTFLVRELRHSIEQIGAGAQEQARSVQTAVELVSQMAAAAEEVTRQAANVAASSHRAMESARSGGIIVGQTVQGMERIQAAVQGSAVRIRELGRLSGQISEITIAITEISEQTNLLALNAAIEAARAGEHGRGFAVVAEEVRKLAARAARSAGEISELVRRIQAGTAEAVQAMEAGTAEVAGGTRLAAGAGAALTDILAVVEQTGHDAAAITQAADEIGARTRQAVAAVESVAAIVEENTAATEQMAAGSEQVTGMFGQVTSVSTQNAAFAQEVSAAVEEMNANAEEIAAAVRALAAVAADLEGRVSRFRLPTGA